MKVKEFMERVGINKTGKALAYIKDGLDEIQMQIHDNMYNHTDMYDDWSSVTSSSTLLSSTGWKEYIGAGASWLSWVPSGDGTELVITNQTDTGNTKGIAKGFNAIKGHTYTLYLKGRNTSAANIWGLHFGTSIGGWDLGIYSPTSISDTIGEFTFSFTSLTTQTVYANITTLATPSDATMKITKLSITDSGLNIEKDKRFYDLPSDMVRLQRVYAKEQLNTDGEYHAIPRFIGKPPKEIDNE